MSVERKMKLCTAEDFEDRAGKQKRAYYRIGGLIEFKDDKTGESYFRGKLSIIPNTTIYVFPEDHKGD